MRAVFAGRLRWWTRSSKVPCSSRLFRGRGRTLPACALWPGFCRRMSGPVCVCRLMGKHLFPERHALLFCRSGIFFFVFKKRVQSGDAGYKITDVKSRCGRVASRVARTVFFFEHGAERERACRTYRRGKRICVFSTTSFAWRLEAVCGLAPFLSGAVSEL